MDIHNSTRSLYFPRRITEAMNSIFDYPLTIVEAPMGYGKTTAVREHLKSAHAQILLHKLYDDSIQGFWEGFCRLFSEVDGGRSLELEHLGFPGDRVSMQHALKIIEAMALPEKTVLFMDDYHLLNGTVVDPFIKLLVVNEIEHFHIVLTARYVKFPDLEELALKGSLLHITQESFEFRPQEIAAYYSLCGVNIEPEDAERLYAATEGWISALYLLMLNYRAEGRFMFADSLYNLVENAVYKPFPAEVKDFLETMSVVGSFTREQAVYLWGDCRAEEYLQEITFKNALVHFTAHTKMYHIHKIFAEFLLLRLERKEEERKRALYQRAGDWYAAKGDYLAAMHYYQLAGDYDSLLSVVELDRGNSFQNEQKERIIQYFDKCPRDIKKRHLSALLVYAMALVLFNEMDLFQKTCEEAESLIQDSPLDRDRTRYLAGELELLKSFTRYNDIMGMSQHHRKACALMKEPSIFITSRGRWTFGSPSVLYLFHRQAGRLEQEVRELAEGLPFYYQLTDGHGKGAERVMEAEGHFNMGDFENAEIVSHQALHEAGSSGQTSILLCALFLQARLSLARGSFDEVPALFKKMQEAVEEKKVYSLIQTIDMCKGFVYGSLRQCSRIPLWLLDGDYDSRHLLFQNQAFFNILYGRALLVHGDYLKLLGLAGHFEQVASYFPNILARIYALIHTAAANAGIRRRGDALDAMKQALDLAMPDKILMPFVENADYTLSLLEALAAKHIHQEGIARILELYKPYHKAVEGIRREYLAEESPRLTAREREVALLASEGYSNRAIGERLFISHNTVKTELKSVFQKTGINSRHLLKRYFELNKEACP